MSLSLMRNVSQAVLMRLRAITSPEEITRLLNMRDYHGFMKSRLPEDFLVTILEPFGLTLKDIQVEVVSVSQDLTEEIHIHKEASAFVTILGQGENLPDPLRASGYIDEDWNRVGVGQEIEIPAGTPHGFTVERGGILYFLSVQSPPIERAGGHDDYYRVSA